MTLSAAGNLESSSQMGQGRLPHFLLFMPVIPTQVYPRVYFFPGVPIERFRFCFVTTIKDMND